MTKALPASTLEMYITSQQVGTLDPWETDTDTVTQHSSNSCSWFVKDNE